MSRLDPGETSERYEKRASALARRLSQRSLAEGEHLLPAVVRQVMGRVDALLEREDGENDDQAQHDGSAYQRGPTRIRPPTANRRIRGSVNVVSTTRTRSLLQSNITWTRSRAPLPRGVLAGTQGGGPTRFPGCLRSVGRGRSPISTPSSPIQSVSTLMVSEGTSPIHATTSHRPARPLAHAIAASRSS